MALQSTASASNPLCLSEIKTEFNSISSNCLTGFYGAASGVPSSGNICISDFLGTSSAFQATINYDSSQAAVTTTSSGITYIDWNNTPAPASLNIATSLTAAGWDGSLPVVATININNLNTSHTSDHHWITSGMGTFAGNRSWATTAEKNASDSTFTIGSSTEYKDSVIPIKNLNLISGAIPSGSTITINMNGFLQGAAGDGGAAGNVKHHSSQSAPTAGSNGEDGGPIFDFSAADYDVTWSYSQGTTGRLFRGVPGGGGAGGFQRYESNWDSSYNVYNEGNRGKGWQGFPIQIYNVTRNKYSNHDHIDWGLYTGSYTSTSSTAHFPATGGLYLVRVGLNGRYGAAGGGWGYLQSFGDALYGNNLSNYITQGTGTVSGPGYSSGTQYYRLNPEGGSAGMWNYAGSYTSNQSGGLGGNWGKIFKYKNSLGATITSDTPPFNWSGTVTVTA